MQSSEPRGRFKNSVTKFLQKDHYITLIIKLIHRSRRAILTILDFEINSFVKGKNNKNLKMTLVSSEFTLLTYN